MVKARAFVIRKTDLDGDTKRITDLAKIFFILSLLNIHSVRGKCGHPRDFLIDNSFDMFCRSEIWLYDDDSAIISVLTTELLVYHYVPRPDKKGDGVD